MTRMLCMVSICFLALPLSGLAAAQSRDGSAQTTTHAAPAPHADACDLEAAMDTTANPEYFWRLRAYQKLDCLIGIVEKALAAKGGQSVMFSREEVERLRTLAIWAKDAAVRIDR
jgi:hypothetical protein